MSRTPPSPRIVITGAGVICSIGAGVEAFEQALYAGASGFREKPLGDGHAVVAEVPDFTPQQWLGPKGIRVLDRSTRLLCVAAQMALDRSGLLATLPADGDPELGLVSGTLFGGLHSIVGFDWSGLTDGPAYVNPMEFPNTVINSPAGQAAIKFGLRGVNSTICAGLASGLLALQYAADTLRFGRARALLAGGAEELCEESMIGFDRAGLTVRTGALRPFQGEAGTMLGEGAALLMLETAASAAARGAQPWAELVGFGCARSGASPAAYSENDDGPLAAMRQALETAGLTPRDIGCVIASANGSRAGDAAEMRALHQLFPAASALPVISAPKASFGEAMGASGALCALAGVLAARRQLAPPTANCGVLSSHLRLSSRPEPFAADHVLINASGCDGNHAAMIVKRWVE